MTLDGPGSVVVHRAVPVPMRDGTVLRADVWRRADGRRGPVLLQRMPYDRTWVFGAQVLAGVDAVRAVEAGYVVVIQDTRGRFASGGDFVPFAREAEDGADTVAWAAALPWADGRVGMFGGSYVGATQLLAATAAPPALGAIAPAVTGDEYWEGWTYQGGVFQLGFALWWTLTSLVPVALNRRPEPERSRLEERWRALVADPDAAFSRLPLDDLDGLEELAPFYREWLDHDRRDTWWRRMAPNDGYGRIGVPALHIGGWHDIFIAGTLRNYTGLVAEADGDVARRGQRLLVGPWAHASYTDTVGERFFGVDADQGSLDMTATHLRFFDEHLRGRPTEEAPVRVFLMGADRWLEADRWPLDAVHEQRWHLHSGGAAATRQGDGVLAREPCGSGRPPDRFTYDPAAPVPTLGGATLLPGTFVARRAGPRDQRAVEDRRDVLVYTSAVLEQDIDVIGTVRAELTFASSAPDTDVTAKLVDVHPDGWAENICDGILALRHRGGLDTVAAGVPGEAYRLTVELGPTANRFRAGHRVRLEVSSSNFPRFARNPNTGRSPLRATAIDLRPAEQYLYHDADRPSALVLPVRS